MNRQKEIPSQYSLYRHFKGKHIVMVDSISYDCDTLEPLVNYIHFNSDTKDMWTRTLSEFLEEVPEDSQKDNVTGQKYRFEPFTLDVGDMKFLGVSTETLLEELKSREDCPVELQEERVADEYYEYGFYTVAPSGQVMFQVMSRCDKEEEIPTVQSIVADSRYCVRKVKASIVGELPYFDGDSSPCYTDSDE